MNSMKRVFLPVVAVTLVSLAQAEGLRSKIMEMDRKVTAALKSKDLAKFKQLVLPNITKDFKHVEYGQTMTFDEMYNQMKQSFAMIDKVKDVSVKFVSIKETGNTGKSVAKHRMVTTMKGPDKKTHVMVFEGTSNDTYVKVNGAWKMSRMEWSNNKMTMDGKPMDMSQMGGK